MNKRARMTWLVVLIAFVGTLANAQTVARGTNPNAQRASVQQQLYRGSKIIGAVVRDRADRKIGVIRDLMLDERRGEIAYVVVSFGDVMGSGRKYHAIPWQALDPSDDGRFYVLGADRDTIVMAPGFDKAKWPDMADRKWSDEVDHYWRRMVGSGTSGNNRLSTPGVSDPEEAGSASGR